MFQKYIILVFPVLLILAACDESNPEAPHEEHFDAFGLVLISSGQIILRVFEGAVDENYPTKLTASIGVGDRLDIKFLDENGALINPPDDGDKTFGYVIGDETILGVHQDEPGAWEFHLEGLKKGSTDIEIQVMHEGHPDFRTPKIPVEVK